jgi:D-alanyl-lipoteichoic acid acyltransferase DltB (MBOAT superfamily)
MRVALYALTSVATGAFQFPTFDQAFARHIAGDPYPWYIGWGTLVLFFFEDLLAMAIFGGVIVACGRMAGFRLLRNTYRPLESQTIAVFWNRYYFYYKELLVDFFFHPTFLTCFRKYKRLRLAFATFMAACVGNMVFHFMRDIHLLADLGPQQAVVGYQSHAFYTFMLALGIIASQLRRRGAGTATTRAARILACIRVALFFCILHVFDAPLDRSHTLGERFLFLFHLFGAQT